MNRVLWAVSLLLGIAAGEVAVRADPMSDTSKAVAGQPSGKAWSHANLAVLQRWVAAEPEDGMPALSSAALDAARARGEAAEIDDVATMLALRLAQLHLLGDTALRARAGWSILDTDQEVTLEPLLSQALECGTLDTFFATLRPVHRDYAALRTALATETDRARRQTIARNMERWRWMPRILGPDHVQAGEFRPSAGAEVDHLGTLDQTAGFEVKSLAAVFEWQFDAVADQRFARQKLV